MNSLTLLNGIFVLMNIIDLTHQSLNNECFTEISLKSIKDIYRLPDDVEPRIYKIYLELAENTLYGISDINITINHRLQIMYLHCEKLDIIRPIILIEEKVKHGLRDKEYIVHRVTDYSYIENTQMIVLYFDHILLPGYYVLQIEFTGVIDNKMSGFFNTSRINKKGDKEWFVTSHTWPIGARRMFPCWDEPRFKAHFEITIYLKNYSVLFNKSETYIQRSYNSELSTVITDFHTLPISSCFIAITLSNIPNITFKWQSNRQQDKEFAHSVVETITNYFEHEWNEFEKSSILHLVIPGLQDDSMTKWGLVSYREEDITYNERLDPIARTMNIAYLIGRKISRERLSTIVSPTWWSYSWVNEGIATLIFIKDIANMINIRISQLFEIQIVQESLRLDTQSFMNPLTSEIMTFSDINSFFSFSYYIKGPAILRMLQYILTDTVFRNGIKRYFKKYSSKSASLDDFWYEMQAAHSEASSKELNIKDVMDPWIMQKSYPVLLAIRHNESVTVMNTLSQDEPGNWSMPFTYTTHTRLYDNNYDYSSSIYWLEPRKHMNISLKSEDNWIILNLRQIGYYRVKYDDRNLLRIAHFLNSTDHIKIPVQSRAQIIDDAFHFMTLGQFNPYIFWESFFVSYLSRETDYVVWYPVIKAIESMSHIFLYSAKNEYFKIKIRSQLRSLLQKIGFEELDDDGSFTRCLRQEAAKWACVLDDPECKKEAVAKFQWHLTNHINNKLQPWWRKWTYCNGLKVANNNTLKRIFDIYEKEFLENSLFLREFLRKYKNTKILEFLHCSNEYSYIISQFLKLKEKLNRDLKMRKVYSLKPINKDYISFFHHIVERHARNNSVLDYIFTNWKRIKPKKISSVVALGDIINHVYFSSQLDKIKKFVNINLSRVKYLTLQIKKFEDELEPSEWHDDSTILHNIKAIRILQTKIETRWLQIQEHDSYLSVYTYFLS